jgi:subtilisin-like proprotein convertase family protein
VDSVDVKLVGLFHTYPDDLDILLESPSGRKLMLMSDAGGFQDVVNLDLGISYNSSVLMPDEGALTLSSYQPADYEPGESLPAPAPAAPYTDDLNLDVPNGNWKLWVNDDAGADVGKILGGWCLSLRVAEPFVTTCTDASSSLTIPGAAPSATSGPAAPYPWELNVGYEGVVVRKVRVRLEGLTHTYPDDLDILVLGPVGGAAILMSDAGGEFDASNALIGWDDDSPTNMPDASTLPSATYRPTNHNTGNPDVFTDLGVGPFGSQLSVFRGLPAKGTWKLYVMDDSDFDVGSATRWCVDIWPLSPVGEATNLRWTSKTAMRWDAAPNASLYDVYRGTPGQLAPLLTALEDSCLAITDHDQTAEGLASLPSPGSMFWYLVVGTNGTYRGPAGNARIGTTPTARTLDSAGACAAP